MASDSDAIDEHLVIAAFLDLGAGHWVEDLRRRFDPLASSVPAHVALGHRFQTTGDDQRTVLASCLLGRGGSEI